MTELLLACGRATSLARPAHAAVDDEPQRIARRCLRGERPGTARRRRWSTRPTRGGSTRGGRLAEPRALPADGRAAHARVPVDAARRRATRSGEGTRRGRPADGTLRAAEKGPRRRRARRRAAGDGEGSSTSAPRTPARFWRLDAAGGRSGFEPRLQADDSRQDRAEVGPGVDLIGDQHRVLPGCDEAADLAHSMPKRQRALRRGPFGEHHRRHAPAEASVRAICSVRVRARIVAGGPAVARAPGPCGPSRWRRRSAGRRAAAAPGRRRPRWPR